MQQQNIGAQARVPIRSNPPPYPVPPPPYPGPVNNIQVSECHSKCSKQIVQGYQKAFEIINLFDKVLLIVNVILFDYLE